MVVVGRDVCCAVADLAFISCSLSSFLARTLAPRKSFRLVQLTATPYVFFRVYQ